MMSISMCPHIRSVIHDIIHWMTTAALLVGLVSHTCSGSGAGYTAETDPSVRRGVNSRWADAESNSIVVPDRLLERRDYSDRHNTLATDSQSSSWDRWFRDWWDSWSNNSFLGGMAWFLGSPVFWWSILAILLAMFALYILMRVDISSYFLQRRSSKPDEEDLEGQRARISDLPFDIVQPTIGLRAQAEMHRNAGDYSKAIVYLFSYLLVELDQSHCIRLERGKTNYTYLRELGPWEFLANFMHPVVNLFERTYFGQRPIDREAFDDIWQRISSFEATLSQIRKNTPFDRQSGADWLKSIAGRSA